MQLSKSHRLNQSAAIIVSSLIVFFIALSSTVWRPAITNQLNNWKLLPEPEKLTELYFVHPNSLPTSYTPGGSQTVSFTLHNLEYQTVTYRYQIIEESQNGSNATVLNSSVFTINQGQYRTVSYPATLVDAGQDAKIVVSIPTVNESIDYVLTRSNQ